MRLAEEGEGGSPRGGKEPRGRLAEDRTKRRSVDWPQSRPSRVRGSRGEKSERAQRGREGGREGRHGGR